MQVEYKSTNMEVLGLKRALNFLKDKVNISEIVTDASTTVISCLGISQYHTMNFTFTADNAGINYS